MHSGPKEKGISLAADSKIAVVRLSALGDIVHTLPAVANLTRAFPDCKVHWICSPPADRLLSLFDVADQVIPIDIRNRNMVGAISEVRAFRNKYRGEYSVAVDFQGLLKSALVARLVSRNTLGFHTVDLREALAARAYRFQPKPWAGSGHVIQKNLHLLTALGISGASVQYPKLLPQKESPHLQRFLDGLDPGADGFIIINVGAGWPTKTPTPELLIRVGRWLRNRIPAVLLWGTPAEHESAVFISSATGIPVTPKTDFVALSQLIGAAKLLLSGDTLALHLADVMETPSVGLFAPTSPQRNGSLLKYSRSVTAETDCRFCYRRACGKMNCMALIPPEVVTSAISEVLNASV